ncbi:SDR family NAD(P)-dependent oxidoreductase [Stenotrophomonas sp.]|uniref:SDR family NAD(P)-dependent oxidoreductase n=1 Tax=Stenotrophomonas sp. TaxID=69392 RepID=UPI0028AFB7CD|nr:SDR family NAD(P)-dependent oxidoreductase [Stenotrophomonas sp.]
MKKVYRQRMNTMRTPLRTALITGATDGLGLALAIALARQHRWKLLLHGRSHLRLEAARASILACTPKASVECLRADFSSMRDTIELAHHLGKDNKCLDLLVNNAGVGIESTRCETQDSHELCVQVNYLSTFTLTLQLQVLLERACGRVICVSSGLQQVMDQDDPDFRVGWDGQSAYARSKWAQAAFTSFWAKHNPETSSTIHSLHPASLMPTKLVLGQFDVQDSLDQGVHSLLNLINPTDMRAHNGHYFHYTTPASAPAAIDNEALNEWLFEWSLRSLHSAWRATSTRRAVL